VYSFVIEISGLFACIIALAVFRSIVPSSSILICFMLAILLVTYRGVLFKFFSFLESFKYLLVSMYFYYEF